VRELFVWYRVDESRAAAARAAVLDLQRALRRDHPRLAARLLVRRDPGSGAQTWMETYASSATPAGIGPDLEASLQARAAALDGLLASPRHVEAFEAIQD
jgi:hypothetical protein